MPTKRLSSLAFTCAAALAVWLLPGCEDAAPASEESLAVDLFLGGPRGLEIVEVYPGSEFVTGPNQAPGWIRYQLEDATGAVIVAGRMPDGRYVRAEFAPD